MADAFYLRLATTADTPLLHELISLSVRGLMQQEYTASQLQAALDNWLGLDTQLILTVRTSLWRRLAQGISGLCSWVAGAGASAELHTEAITVPDVKTRCENSF